MTQGAVEEWGKLKVVRSADKLAAERAGALDLQRGELWEREKVELEETESGNWKERPQESSKDEELEPPAAWQSEGPLAKEQEYWLERQWDLAQGLPSGNRWGTQLAQMRETTRDKV